jgi:hypothetical protein
MIRKLLSLFILLSCSFALTSCSGLSDVPGGCIANCNGGGGGGGGNGSATVSVDLQAIPFTTQPANFTLLSFSANIVQASLVPASGNAINFAPSGTFTVDFTRLQSDSISLGTAAAPAGTYTGLNLTLSNATITYCVQTNPGVPGCAAGTIATLSGGALAPALIFAQPLTLTSGQLTGIAASFNIGNALTISAQNVPTFNAAAINVLTSATLPSALTSLPTPATQLDYIEDISGIVTFISNTSISLQTGTRGAFTATFNSGTIIPAACANISITACAPLSSFVNIDAILNNDGTFAVVQLDPILATNDDWIEGTVTTLPTVFNQFQIVANDLTLSTATSLVGAGGLPLGTLVNVNISTNPTFFVDDRGLLIPAGSNFSGATVATNVIFPGQMIAVRVKQFTSPTGTPLAATVTTDTVGLRYSRVNGVANAVNGGQFSIQGLPSLFGATFPLEVQLTSGTPATNYDGVAGSNSLVVGSPYSIRALYFNIAPNFTAAKVRAN